MRKSPFSTPRGNRGHPGGGWSSNERRRNRGYVAQRNISVEYYSPNSTQESPTGDFIPFTASPTASPTSYQDNRQSFSTRRGRNRSYSGSSCYSNNSSPGGRFNNSYSPYKHNGRPQRGWNKNSHRTPQKEIPISQYVDLQSFLDDPWKDLVDVHNTSMMDDANILINTEPDLSSSFNDSRSEELSICNETTQDPNLKGQISNRSEENSENSAESQDSND